MMSIPKTTMEKNIMRFETTIKHFNKLTDEEKRTIISARQWDKADKDYPYYKQMVRHWNPLVLEYNGKPNLTFCVECGTEIPSDFHICPVCGIEY